MTDRVVQIDRPSLRSNESSSGEPHASSEAMRKRLALHLDERELAAELRSHIEGEVRFDAGSRALYATDASNYRQVPIGVVIPRSTDDIIRTVAIARRFGAPILARGGGTSLAGQ